MGAILNSARGGTVDPVFVSQLGDTRTDFMPLILSNHDSFAGDRVWNQFNGDEEQYKLAAASYLLAARAPFTYYGEELGMANAAGLSGDHALRTPMSWTSDPTNAGFSAVTPFRELSANSTTQNVELQTGDTNSLMAAYSELLILRRDYPVIGSGSLDVQAAGNDPVLLLVRNSATDCAVIAINYSNLDQPINVSTACQNDSFSIVFGGTGSANSDGAGAVADTIPARTAVVYYATQ
jgi:glycosidase